MKVKEMSDFDLERWVALGEEATQELRRRAKEKLNQDYEKAEAEDMRRVKADRRKAMDERNRKYDEAEAEDMRRVKVRESLATEKLEALERANHFVIYRAWVESFDTEMLEVQDTLLPMATGKLVQ